MADASVVLTRQGLLDRARNAGVRGDRALKDFAIGCLMARLGAHNPGVWMLKGGESLLTRHVTTRDTRDLDLRSANRNVEVASREFEGAIVGASADGVVFAIEKPTSPLMGSSTGGYEGYRIYLRADLGTELLIRLHVDLVAGRELTGTPTEATRTPLVAVPGIAPVRVLLFPAVDHIADKVCAIHEVHGENGWPSSRAKDLHDLCTLRGLSGIEAAQLSEALAAESTTRHLTLPAKALIPPTMKLPYEQLAQRTDPHPSAPRAFDDALAAVSDFLDPVMGGDITTGVWDPDTLRWIERH